MRGAYWRGGLIGEGGLLERGLIGEGAYWRGGLIGEGGLLERGAYLRGCIYLSKKTAMEIMSLYCNKLKIITQYISYNRISYISFLSLYYGGGGLLERGHISFFTQKRGLIREGSFDFFTQEGGLLERGAYLRGGLNREITVFLNCLFLYIAYFSKSTSVWLLAQQETQQFIPVSYGTIILFSYHKIVEGRR